MLRFANFLSFNVNPTYHAICAEIERTLGIPARLENGVTFDSFFNDELAGGYICGLPYSKFADLDDPPVELLVAPVLSEPRCAGQAVYFSDVVVPADSGVETFADLEGKTFTYNELVSYSGYHVMDWHLREKGLNWDFFGAQTPSGAHVNSITMIANGEADVAALDSHSFAAAKQLDPTLAQRVRIIDSIGPSPHPPVVVGRGISAELKADLRDIYLTLHKKPTLQPLLATAAIDRFVTVDDAFYNPLRERVDTTHIHFSSACG